VIIPARDEALTLADVVSACRACSYAREVVVVDDNSTDDTAEVAAAAGAKVIRRDTDEGSKAHAMEAGVAASDADAFLFVDGDCLGLTGHHLDEICRPFVEGRAVMSLGWFDYGILNAFVNRFPPTTGERVIPRWVWEAIPPEKLDGYTIELVINEVIAEGRLPTVSRTMSGVTHRTKREKMGRLEGTLATVQMYVDLLRLPFSGLLRWRTYWFYLRGLTVER
jgi:glycosyltransferase involved in cell wall biosynthesis